MSASVFLCLVWPRVTSQWCRNEKHIFFMNKWRVGVQLSPLLAKIFILDTQVPRWFPAQISTNTTSFYKPLCAVVWRDTWTMTKSTRVWIEAWPDGNNLFLFLRSSCFRIAVFDWFFRAQCFTFATAPLSRACKYVHTLASDLMCVRRFVSIWCIYLVWSETEILGKNKQTNNGKRKEILS